MMTPERKKHIMEWLAGMGSAVASAAVLALLQYLQIHIPDILKETVPTVALVSGMKAIHFT